MTVPAEAGEQRPSAEPWCPVTRSQGQAVPAAHLSLQPAKRPSFPYARVDETHRRRLQNVAPGGGFAGHGTRAVISDFPA